MNNVLSLKGEFQQQSRDGRVGAPSLPTAKAVSTKHLLALLDDMQALAKFWAQPQAQLLHSCLISAEYIKVAAKSNRIGGFFSQKSHDPNDLIVGAKFTADGERHIITYCMDQDLVTFSMEQMRRTANILAHEFGGTVQAADFNIPQTVNAIDFGHYGIAKTAFQRCIVDAYFVKRFDIPSPGDIDPAHSTVVTLYDTKEDPVTVLNRLGINARQTNIIDAHTLRLDENALRLLLTNAPYLISMAVSDVNQLAPDDFEQASDAVTYQVPAPGNEPIIGVFDTLFDESVYFHEWVSYERVIDSAIEATASDYQHGTAVTAIIADGPQLNPALDDGCGRFRVKHFGISLGRAYSSVSIIQAIEKAVLENPDIHVWNLSLGAVDGINANFISAEAAVLDQIQYEHHVIFVVAGTNKADGEGSERIGAPADSINSLVVSAVDDQHQPAMYSRRGIVLSFFTKPDVAYYGGSSQKPLKSYDARGPVSVMGTSFAAPWIARKLAYLMEVMGLSREVAKALIVDAAIGWYPERDHDMLALRGNGVVPVRIEDLLETSNDEIKFVLEGQSEKYNTYNYRVPVPVVAQKQPFVAKATMCYFPQCSRNQGVDYTNTELDLYFGRITNNGGVKTINENVQDVDDWHRVNEAKARSNFRKWDNVKHISETLKQNPRAKKAYANPLWGINVKTKERLRRREGERIRFGIVVTLKEIKGVNRIEDFIQKASLQGWLVTPINIKNRLDVYQQAEQDIDFD
jgi:hypothetical protein